MAGVCAAGLVNKFLDGEAFIKWPNDVVVTGRKICGILTESGITGTVLGIGINLNRESFPDDIADKATSLRLITGYEYERAEIIKLLLIELSRYYEKFEGQGVGSFIGEYRALCINIGKTVVICENGCEYRAEAVGVSDCGGLEIITEGGERRLIKSGEVSVRGLYGYVG
jgi:BirA family biotin operon repressor/biotin-[acetyl-CoA-carboxylase] ligase